MSAGEWARRGALLVFAPTLVLGCRFEQRPDLPDEEPVGGAPDGLLHQPGSTVEDSVLATVTAVVEALAVGDVTRMEQLTTRDALIFDQEGDGLWTGADASARIPLLLRGGSDGEDWEPQSSSFALLSEGAALLSLRFQVRVSGESVPRNALESWVLVRTAEGWRVRYLHRSGGLGRAGPPP